MAQFTAHEGQDTVLIRGTMAHAAMSLTEFTDWLVYEHCTRTAWVHSGGTPFQTCNVIRPDGSTRSQAFRISNEER